MSKKRFVRDVVIRRLPPLNELPQTIAYAESAYQELSRYGYGDVGDAKIRDARNWYAALNAQQKRWFDRFWNAFNHKQGKNNAARRWAQLGDLTDADYQTIVDAATADYNRPLPAGQTRKWAEGWLFEMRWIDYAPVHSVTDDTRRRADTNRLLSEIAGLEQLYAASPNPVLKRQLDDLKHQLGAMRKRADAATR